MTCHQSGRSVQNSGRGVLMFCLTFFLAVFLLVRTTEAGQSAGIGQGSGAAPRGQLSLQNTVDSPGLLIRDDVTLAPNAISPGVSPTVQDSALLRFTIAREVPVFIAVFIDTVGATSGPQPIAIFYPCSLCEVSYPSGTPITIGINAQTVQSLLDGTYSVKLVVTSLSFNRTEGDSLTLIIDRQRPVLTSLTITSPGLLAGDTYPVVKNGSTIVINAVTDQKGYTLSADFSNLDNHPASDATQVVDNGDKTYTIRHTIADENTRADSLGRFVSLTFRDVAGNVTRDNSLHFCLLNEKPRLVSYQVTNGTGDPPAFKSGDEVDIEMRWEPHNPLAQLVLTPRSWTMSSFATNDIQITGSGGIYTMRFTIPNDDTQDGEISVFLDARTNGCGFTSGVKIATQLDNHRIAFLTLNSIAPTTRDSALTVSGRAPGALNVEFTRDVTLVTTLAADSLGNFSGRVPLIAGVNEIKAQSQDKFFSKGPSTTFSVTRVIGSLLVLPPHLKPGAVIRVVPSQTATALRIEMWSLAGDLIAVLEDRRRTDLYELTWDGLDASGLSLKTGPLLCRIDASLVDGRHEITKRAVLFTAR